MKKLIFFLGIFLYADISSVLLKIKEIENKKKVFLKYPNYNIFTSKVYKVEKRNNIIKVFAKKSINLILEAIFNNSAKINGIWLKRGDKILGFRVIKILHNRVILQKESKIVVLRVKYKKVLK